ncbi:hypothetical protein CNECB9_660018 [Cupriavidus necator]|uniref:EamA domain-containing protein n=1 Tax=Cupriavidus necator TaxID=106590 RepID=A0A1K0JLR1_CUPNE|nr:hypothetical protein CNECB9_660018 [Cupriavidus necator]
MAGTWQGSQTLSASYAYVNPPVALAMGAWLGGEQIAPQTLGAVMLILVARAVLSLGTLRTARAQAA